MSDIGKQVAAMCEAILNFQNYIIKVRQDLFLYPEVCDTLIWNHIIGQQHQTASKQNIVKFMSLQKIQIVPEAISYLFHEHSIYHQSYLTKKQFTGLFIDQNKKHIEDIIQVRNNKFSYAKNHVPHFKINDLLKQIFKKTLQFLVVKENMKRNIYSKRRDLEFSLEKPQAKYFLLFINQYKPDWYTQQCEIILRHILKYRKSELKQFYYFFVPFSCQSKKINPDEKILKKPHEKLMSPTYSSMIDHKKASNFGKKQYKLKKTLYLK